MGIEVMGLVKNQLMPSAAPDQPNCGHLAVLVAIYVALSFNHLAICIMYQALVVFWNFVKFRRNDRQLEFGW